MPDDKLLPRLKDMMLLAELAGEKPPQEGAEERVSDTHEPEYFEGRKGFSRDFLQGFPIELPKPEAERQEDMAPLLDGSGHELRYHNFSVVMSMSRRIAMFTACNIHGTLSARDKIQRKGKDQWYYDLRIDPAYQIGEELYVDNELDRGHLVRREDPVWGPNAANANYDTFHFTNCSPQHSGFNQKTWLGLENYILDNARSQDVKATVFTGPVFMDDDPEYRGVQIPRSYWKVVAVTDEGRKSATAYEISQEKLIQELEFVYGRYKTYQVSIRHIERMTGLNFGKLRTYDGFSNEESFSGSEVRFDLPDWHAIRI